MYWDMSYSITLTRDMTTTFATLRVEIGLPMLGDSAKTLLEGLLARSSHMDTLLRGSAELK